MSAKFNSQQEKSRLEELTTRILEQSKHVGADACEVAASASVGLDVQARLGQPEKLEMTRDQSLSITVFLGESRGSASDHALLLCARVGDVHDRSSSGERGDRA